MDIHIIIFILTLLIFVPLAGVLLYVWHKYGKGESKVMLARAVFLFGFVSLFGYMLII